MDGGHLESTPHFLRIATYDRRPLAAGLLPESLTLMMALAHRTAGSTTRQLATFRLGELLLGIDICCICEINRVTDFTPVPDAPPQVKGVVNLRGDVVTVINLRAILDLPPQESTHLTRLLIVQAEDEAIGLLVDRVSDVATVKSAEKESLPANLSGVDCRFFSGMYRLGAELLVELDIAAALAQIEN